MSSKRGYLTIPELEEYANITVTDATEAYDQISQAEELIDAYVGPQNKSISRDAVGKVTTATATKITDTHSVTPLSVTDGTYIGCTIEIIGGTGAGTSLTITGSSQSDSSISFDSTTATIDDTSIYRIYQLAKFPRRFDTKSYDNVLYKSIPEAVKRATAAQVSYMIEMGEDFFAGPDSDMASESIGNYSYSNGQSSVQGSAKLIAPRARNYLRGIKNRKGVLIPENPTWL